MKTTTLDAVLVKVLPVSDFIYYFFIKYEARRCTNMLVYLHAWILFLLVELLWQVTSLGYEVHLLLVLRSWLGYLNALRRI